MIKLILIIFLMFTLSGCGSNNDNEQILSKAKALVACKNKGGLATHISPPTIFILKATCKNGELVDYTNILGPEVAEEYNKLESEKRK